MVGGPNGENVVYGEGLGLPTEQTVDSLFNQFGKGVARAEGTGLLALRVSDCRNQLPETQVSRMSGGVARATGVKLSLGNTEAPGWTLIGGTPASDITPIATDSRGVAGFANVDPRGVIIEAIAPNGTPYGRTAVNVRPNQLTQANIRPDYSYAD
jgi:hypothetical protein